MLTISDLFTLIYDHVNENDRAQLYRSLIETFFEDNAQIARASLKRYDIADQVLEDVILELIEVDYDGAGEDND